MDQAETKVKGAKKGFAAMDPNVQREIARKGGVNAHAQGKAHEFTPDEGRAAGVKGGTSVSRNREHMADIGRRGGRSVSQDRDHMARVGRKGGRVVAQDRAHMAEIGRRGGLASRTPNPPPEPEPSEAETVHDEDRQA